MLTRQQKIISALTKQLLVIFGPSGVGKTTIMQQLRENPLIYSAKTYTTRPMRSDEYDVEQYYFIHDEEFRQKVISREIMQYSSIYNYLYGIPSNLLNSVPNDKHFVLLDVDINGYQFLRVRFPHQCIGIFIAMPLTQMYQNIINGMGSKNYDEHELQKRLITAQERLQLAHNFDYLIINQEGNLSETLSSINAIITTETLRMPLDIDLLDFLK